MNLPLLIAAIGLDDLIKIGFVLFFIIVPIVGQLLAKMRQPKPPADQAPRPPRPAGNEPLHNEIDAFLRQAAQRKRQPKAGRPRRSAAVRAKVVEHPVRAEVVGDRPVGGHVEKHLQKFVAEKKEFDERASQLGDEVAHADDKLEARLKHKFDHKLGTLGSRTGETAAAPAPAPTGYAEDEMPALPAGAAAGFAPLLASAAGLRQAIVLTEILHRPTERWE